MLDLWNTYMLRLALNTIKMYEKGQFEFEFKSLVLAEHGTKQDFLPISLKRDWLIGSPPFSVIKLQKFVMALV